jgi:hypothetical protein
MNQEQFKVKKRDTEASGSSLKSIHDSYMKGGKSYTVVASTLNQNSGMIHCLIVCENNRLMSFPCDVLEFVPNEEPQVEIEVTTPKAKSK